MMSVKALLAVFFLMPAFAQLAPPNQAGVTVGHIHLYVRDVEEQERFWTLLGGTPIAGRIQFPGVYIILRKQDPTGGSVGSVVDHIGFKVKDLNALLAKLEAAGVKVDPGTTPTRRFVTAPDNVRVEVMEDGSISGAAAIYHVHLFSPDAKATQAWYVKNFGAVPGKRPSGNGHNVFRTATLPGAEITITQKDVAAAPTKGRSLEHIGFEITNIDAFVKKLEAAGTQTEMGVHKSSSSDVRVAHITDPWGTRIELTEGLRFAAGRSDDREPRN
jgi:catechol 2,3-dioxygenase-like lactoylglutathione lyase family enzyme